MSFNETSSSKSKYARGVKRNQIIQQWIQGIEDPEYEVFLTKKEGKHIVKLRESPLSESDKQSALPVHKDKSYENLNSIETHEEDSVEINNQKPPPVVKRVKSRPISRKINPEDQTINLEILEQLRNLGEKIHNDRFKKEQEQYIKHVVNKELSKSRIRSKYIPDVFINETNESVNETEPEEFANFM